MKYTTKQHIKSQFKHFLRQLPASRILNSNESYLRIIGYHNLINRKRIKEIRMKTIPMPPKDGNP